MTNSSKRKGDAAEREAAEILTGLLGVPVRRKLGAGRQDDVGDLDGVREAVIQVVSRAVDVVNVGVVRKPMEAERQRERADARFAATMLRVRGGTWRIVLTLEQWTALYKAAREGR